MSEITQKLLSLIKKKDLQNAITEARKKERDFCEREHQKTLERALEIERGKWILEVKALEAELSSMALRMRRLEEQEKRVRDVRQELREINVKQKQITSDLVQIALDWQERKSEEMQPFLRLMDSASDIDKKLDKLPSLEG